MNKLTMTLLISGSLLATILGLALGGVPAKAATGPGYETFLACCYPYQGQFPPQGVTVQPICIYSPNAFCPYENTFCPGLLGFCFDE